MKLLFLDTETTGRENGRMIQLAYRDDMGLITVNKHFKPPVPIEIGAMAAHHITNEMCSAFHPFDQDHETRDELTGLINNGYIVVAHNAPFDIDVLKREGIEVPRYICTLKMSQYLLEPQEQYKLAYLYYALDCYKQIKVENWHDAQGDITALELVWHKLFKKWKTYDNRVMTDDELIEELVQFTLKPMLLKYVPFGKHKGKLFEEVALKDRDYLNWLMYKMENKGADLEYTVRHYLHLL